MPKTSLSVPNPLTQQEARQRLHEFLPQVRERYQGQITNVEESWEGDTLHFSFSTFGIQIKGTIAVEDSEVKFTGELPLAAMMFKGRIEQSIRDELTKLLA